MIKGKTNKSAGAPKTLSYSNRLPGEFYIRDVLEVAPDLLGKNLTIKLPGNTLRRFSITEVEAYRGEEDRACHAFRGRTTRTEIMYAEGGRLYMYFVYGMYWMMNIVTGSEDQPQAVLIRGLKGFSGPGILTRELGINGGFYGEDLTVSQRIWIENTWITPEYKTAPRKGIAYAYEPWKSIPWRWIAL